jgi:hypothetical protein
MVKARGRVTCSNIPKAAYAQLGEPEVEIAVWTPRPDGEPPYEQIHFIMKLPGFPWPLIMRFKSPDTLGFFIEEPIRYRRIVWPDAEPIKSEDEATEEVNPISRADPEVADPPNTPPESMP